MSSREASHIIHADSGPIAGYTYCERPGLGETVPTVSTLNSYGPPVVLALIVVCAILAIWLAGSQRRVKRLETRLDELFGDNSGQSGAQMVAEYLATVRQTSASVNQLQAAQTDLSRIIPSMIRHVGLVRFSPFHDTGSDQSFALALLDGHGDGVVVTALHSRSDSRLYAKPIERYRSQYSLTPEEREAMTRATGERPAAVARSS